MALTQALKTSHSPDPNDPQETQPTMKFVLVAGATGYLGKHVVHELKRQGHRVRALVRNREKLWKRGPFLEPAVGPEVDEIVVADLTRPETLRGICRDIEYVISCVGLTRDAGKQTFADVDYQGNHHLLLEAQQSPELKKFIYVSLLTQALDPNLEVIQAKERFVRELQESPTTSCIIRPTGYFSDMTEYLKMAKRGRAYVLGHGESTINPIHGADLAQVCVKAMIAKEKEWAVGGPQTLTQKQIAQLAFEVLGKPAKISHLPPGLVGLVTGFTRLYSRQKADTLAFIAEAAQKGGVAPAQGQELLQDYFKEFIASPFFRES
ncbi:hypothetical protein COW36_22160 [bacterium (Candidatus Blackallbacteria) CG17_big_fil_post_rev_8_21_14_2_50_48_46]|uniref:NAD(P)-binding domain-containing protein n=1 Tax=bacterium (Candidatus Blackallbacteria) CG17_big_fil_post_rev_8_21_14_2_50_48_46 TaxID=2014261 RepID=A0A2M7FZP7_9BACT|nr:MAG: hypothetical protein COW64_13590 [bacterium (Candidatus Blackallbacteria) CG18_big_fil_WC_8_21_14_2_50_49_26]PIW14363.1 MAG: hypothetical protein COW36_22160 [bacterium (Candidatus Blackallbacteria) CG17_big_fil_post_rev_8_21_14_2_50_48_46]PIW45632.1 MAG: hypothetical protein COW20_19765 [bacterium (Candidatus Blackallbacteria) CG13_big_fil_rev_8_21_14_2_50_49_14]